MSGFDHPEVAPRLLGAVTVALTGAAGALDAVTFFAYNEVFASTMTGNLILLGLDVGRGRWLETAEALCAIGGYTAGLALGTVIAGLIMRRLPWRSAVGVALTVELGLLVALGLGYYGFVSPESDTVRAVLLVAGGAVAMGIQAAALRYVGPTGTPTNFLTGTVTNWVSAMVELHKPRWDGNSALRIVAVAVAAALGALVQVHAPALTYALPVLLVLVAVVLMGRVVVANHGGLTRGEPQFRDLDQLLDELDVSPGRDGADHLSAPHAGADGRTISGRVLDPHRVPRQAAMTVIDENGLFVARRLTDDGGRYELVAPRPGVYTVVCSPVDGSGGVRPRATTVTLHGGPVVQDLVLDHHGGDPAGGT
ncbi:MAG: DUF1275 family protein [Pseudonocardia sediminis]